MPLRRFNNCWVFLQVGTSSVASCETASSAAGNSAHQRSVQLPPDYSFEPPPSISGGSASAYNANLAVGMLHEIRARMDAMDRKEAERDQMSRDRLDLERKMAAEMARRIAEMEKKLAEERRERVRAQKKFDKARLKCEAQRKEISRLRLQLHND